MFLLLLLLQWPSKWEKKTSLGQGDSTLPCISVFSSLATLLLLPSPTTISTTLMFFRLDGDIVFMAVPQDDNVAAECCGGGCGLGQGVGVWRACHSQEHLCLHQLLAAPSPGPGGHGKGKYLHNSSVFQKPR